MASQRHVNVGGVQVGGGAPVVVQTMTKTETANLTATMDQIRRVADAGADPDLGEALRESSGPRLMPCATSMSHEIAFSRLTATWLRSDTSTSAASRSAGARRSSSRR